MAIVKFCQTQLTLEGGVTVDFRTKPSQINYFDRLSRDYETDVNVKVDGFIDMITIKRNVNEIKKYDYLFIYDETDYNRDNLFFYFIIGVEYNTKTSCNVYLKLDVMQTYLFDYIIGQSFVERCHVPRWTSDGNPTPNNLDEGLEYGPTVIVKTEKVKDLGLNYVICSTSPLGEVKDTSSGGSGGSGGSSPTSGDWTNGVPSKEMFRYLKGFEGYGPYLYNDSGGTPTIGYGITGSEPTEFNKLKGMQPCPEGECAKICWDVLIRKYGKPIVNAVKKLGCTKQRQFDALLDLAYNGGTDLVINSSGNRDLANAIKRNPNDEAYIRPIWEKYWVSDGHTQQPGLVARRKAECNMFFGKPYEVRTIPKLGSGGNVIGEFKGDGWLPS